MLVLASLASAQVGEQKETADFSMSGVVKAVDAAKGMIALGDVKVGWRVAVDGDLRDGEKFVTYLEVIETP